MHLLTDEKCLLVPKCIHWKEEILKFILNTMESIFPISTTIGLVLADFQKLVPGTWQVVLSFLPSPVFHFFQLLYSFKESKSNYDDPFKGKLKFCSDIFESNRAIYRIASKCSIEGINMNLITVHHKSMILLF